MKCCFLRSRDADLVDAEDLLELFARTVVAHGLNDALVVFHVLPDDCLARFGRPNRAGAHLDALDCGSCDGCDFSVCNHAEGRVKFAFDVLEDELALLSGRERFFRLCLAF